MLRHITHSSIFGIAALTVLIHAAPADASWIASHPSICTDRNYFVGNFPTTSHTCPLNESDTLTRDSVTSLQVDVYDYSSSSTVSAQACRESAVTTAYECGPAVQSSVAGIGFIKLVLSAGSTSMTAWTNEEGTAFVYVTHRSGHQLKGFMATNE